VINQVAVYRKTARGLEAIASRSHGLTPRQRSVLIMMDGKRTVEDLAKLGAVQGDPALLLAELETGGFAELVGGVAAARPPLSPAGGPSAQPLPEVAPTGEAIAGPLTAALPRPVPTQVLTLPEAKRLATRLLNDILGPLANDLCMRVEAARNPADYVAAVKRAYTVVREVRGAGEAERFGNEIETHLPAT
jgi:hypothetical protein